MKVFTTILKVLAVIALLAGIIYLVATYGDKIVAWAKKFLPKKNKGDEFFADEDEEIDENVEDIDDADFVG